MERLAQFSHPDYPVRTEHCGTRNRSDPGIDDDVVRKRSAFAQSGAGSIQGTVTDSSRQCRDTGRFDSRCESEQPGWLSDTKTNSRSGIYAQVPDLFLQGTYTVSTTAPGMQTNQAERLSYLSGRMR